MKFKISRASRLDIDYDRDSFLKEIKRLPPYSKKYMEIEKKYNSGIIEAEIELNTIKDIMDLHEKYGDLLIMDDNTILIYDDYIE